jgi:hypothetical protein
MKTKRDPLLDVIGSCSDGDGRLAENIDEALYGEEAFPVAGRLPSAKQVVKSVKSPNDRSTHKRLTVRKLRKRRGSESHRT